MADTTFLPPASLAERIAPTEPCAPLAWPCTAPARPMLRGVVHDPTARRMGGVAGHAGLFSTGDDLAIVRADDPGRGQLEGRARAVAAHRRHDDSAGDARRRCSRCGAWAGTSTPAISANRGELLPVGSFGHTGFTGTSIWIDPLTRTFVIVLSNRVHPAGKGDATPLRARVASVVASAIPDAVVPPQVALTGHRLRPGAGAEPAAACRRRFRPASTSCAPRDSRG